MSRFYFIAKGRKYESPTPKPSGRELLEAMDLSPAEDYELFMKLTQREYEPVQPDEVVDLTQPGIESFRVRSRHKVSYELDGEWYSSHECLITPAEILTENGFDPEKFYLKKIEGNREITYKNDVNALISLRPRDKFISCKKAPTPVS